MKGWRAGTRDGGPTRGEEHGDERSHDGLEDSAAGARRRANTLAIEASPVGHGEPGALGRVPLGGETMDLGPELAATPLFEEDARELELAHAAPPARPAGFSVHHHES